MAYDKMALQDAGGLLTDLILALSDGAGADDIPEGIALVKALSGVAGDISGDTDAAVADILAGAASAFADSKRDAV